MMTDAGVTYDEVLAVPDCAGITPAGTPFENIAPGFINGWITVLAERADFIKVRDRSSMKGPA